MKANRLSHSHGLFGLLFPLFVGLVGLTASGAVTLVVSNLQNAGAGSFRQALLDANSRGDTPLITFDIPGSGPFVIQPSSPFPTLTSPVRIDGHTQPGFLDRPVIRLLGSPNANHGLEVRASGCLIRGLAIANFNYGVVLHGSNTRVEGCYIGTLDGETPSANRGFGVVSFSSANVIGGSEPGQRNVISGNTLSGIDLEGVAAVGNQIIGNIIGLNRSGSRALGNGGAGILLYASSAARIGGSNLGERNIIGGNQFSGIEIAASGARNRILGNFIGVDHSGTIAVPNRGAGVFLSSASLNQVGGAGEGEGNLISGNILSGVNLNINITLGGVTEDNQILGNRIGTSANGLQAIPNLQAGILISGAVRRTVVGGANPGEGNLISGNRFNGIEIFGPSVANRIQGNVIGLNLSQSVALANGGAGVLVTLATETAIGGPVAGARNLISGNKLSGIEITGNGSRSRILGNWIGLDGTGSRSLPNQEAGILLSTASANQIGGSAPGEGNVISGNALSGINLNINPRFGGVSEANIIQGNRIGVTPDGEQPLGNAQDGILAFGDVRQTIIGGEALGAGNIISDNKVNGIELNGDVRGTQILGNQIGLSASGSVLPNSSAGILLSGFDLAAPSETRIGNSRPGGTNWISGNRLSGIEVRGRGPGNQILGNQIGTSFIPAPDSGNANHGVFISQDEDPNTPLERLMIVGNVIAHNAYSGVFVENRQSDVHLDSVGVDIRQNSIFSNGRLAIDLGDDGLQANDPQDRDVGPNGYANYPELGQAILVANGLLEIDGALQGAPHQTYTIDFYLNPTCSQLGSGDATFWVGSSTVTSIGEQQSSVFKTATPIPLGLDLGPDATLTATSTDAEGNTSELSPCVVLNALRGPPRITGQPLDADVEVNQGAKFRVLAVGTAPLQYQWSVDDQPVAGATGAVFEYTEASGRNHVISVTVKNAQGSVTSRDALLRVLPQGGDPNQLSDIPLGDLWLPNGEVNALATLDNMLFVGGDFTSFSAPASGASLVDRLDSSQERSFPRFDGVVRCAVPDGEGGMYVGGQFSSVDGLQRSNLVHLLSDDSVDLAWVATANAEVLTLALTGDRLHIGGRFTQLNGQRRLALGAVEARTGLLLPWKVEVHVTAEPINTPIAHSLKVQGDRVFAAGNFGVLAVEGATPVAPLWQGRLDRGTMVANGLGLSLALGPATVYLAGTFERVNGLFRTNLVALDAASGTILGWQAEVAGTVQAIEYVCDSVVLAGDFLTVNQQPRERLAVLNPRSGALLPWTVSVDGPITTLSSIFNTLFISGSFHRVGSEARDWIAAVDYASGTTLSWTPKLRQPADSVVPLGRSVLLGAGLSVPSVSRRHFAALDLRTGKPLPWVLDADGPVQALLATNGMVFLGGGFTQVNGSPRRGLAAWDVTAGRLANGAPSVGGTVSALAFSGNTLYVGGDFDSVLGAARRNIAAIRVANPMTVLPWNPGIEADEASPLGVATVHSIAVDAAGVYVGGRFDHVGGIPIVDLAVLDPVSGSLLPWRPVQGDPSVDRTISSVRQLVLAEEKLWVVGDFLRSPTFGDWRGGLASFAPSSRTLLPWNPAVSWSTDLPFEVRTFARHAGAAYVGGHFGYVYGLSRTHLAAVNPVGNGEVLSWAPNADDTVHVLLSAGTQLIAGGRFKSIGGRVIPYLASFLPQGAPVIRKQPAGGVFAVGSSVQLSVGVTGAQPLSLQWWKDGQPLANAAEAVLSIPSAHLADTGRYQLVVTNVYGVVSSREVFLQVVEPVKIMQQPEGMTTVPGTSVLLSVVATGNPSPIYQWRLNGVNIPGADRSTYLIPNGHPTNSGSYSVVVANPGSAISSDIATVIFTSPLLPFADLRADAGLLLGAEGLGSATNIGATREVGEPNHADKFGGRSVWARWVAPAGGVATFSTRGSTFDTLLAVYTNTVAGLGRVVADEDRGGFATSLAAFNAQAGTEYWIAVDGFVLASGDVVVSWNLDTNTLAFPRIITQPLSQTAVAGQDVTFSVTVASATPVTYQWMRDCVEIPGANNDILRLTKIGLEEVGVYAVRVKNGSSQMAESDSVLLELSSASDVVSQDKLQDLFLDELLAGTGRRVNLQGPAVAGWIAVPMGGFNGKTVNNFGATTQEREPNHCDVIGGASKWFRLQGEAVGIMALDTLGSSFDTVLAVYTLPNGGSLNNLTNLSDLKHLRLMACDDNGAGDRQRSVLRFPAQPGVDYLVAVDSVGGVAGKIQLNWQLGQVPLLSGVPQSTVIKLGGRLTLQATSTNVGPSPRYQWRLNRAAISGATNSVWEIGVLKSGLAGTYEVMLSNVFGVTTSVVAEVGVTLVPLQLTWQQTPRGRNLTLWYPEAAPEPLAFETTSDLRTWRREQVFTPTNTTLVWEEVVEENTIRFFQVVPVSVAQGGRYKIWNQ